MRLLPALLLFACLAATAHAETALPAAVDLQRSAAQAQARHQALIVLFSLPDCPWCERARQLSYADLLAQGQPVVQVEMAPGHPLRDFDGKPSDGLALAARLHVKLAPTALFVGAGGRELAPRLVGVGTVDYYAAQVDAALEQARQQR